VNTWLLLDVSNMAYRAFYTTGDLSHEGAKTGVAFGVLRDVLNLQDLHQPKETIFCFDVGRSKRREIDPRYKRRKRPGNAFEEEARSNRRKVRRQVDKLRTKILPAIGFRNLFWQEGYEADDVIASVCGSLPDDARAVIVSTDEDLFQLLREDWVAIWNPTTKRAVTAESFRREWDVEPEQWADVKALAGCKGDNVIGIDGVGNKTAARYLSGTLKPSTKAWMRIERKGLVWNDNLPLTQLPLLGVRRFELRKDRVTPGRWNRVLEKLGIKSLMGRMVG
jgi:DNA polymerase-1